MFPNFIRPLAIFAFFTTQTAAIAQSNILEELRSGQHFDRATLSSLGSNILSAALAGKRIDITLLGKLFKDGDNGFPKNTTVAERLLDLAYQRGEWTAAYDLGEIAEGLNNFKLAYRYYEIFFLAAAESDEHSARTSKGWTPGPIPNFTHFGYAKTQYLLWTKRISAKDYYDLDQEAKREATRRGFFHNCEEKSRLECKTISEWKQQRKCQTQAEDRCYRNIAQH